MQKIKKLFFLILAILFIDKINAMFIEDIHYKNTSKEKINNKKCKFCKNTYDSNQLLAKHVMKNHFINFFCPYPNCRVNFYEYINEPAVIFNHLYSHITLDEKISCTKNYKIPVIKTIKKDRSKTTTIQIDQECPICEEIITDDLTFKKHLLNHCRKINENKYECCLCGNNYRPQNKQTLYRHIERTHLRKALNTITNICPLCDFIDNNKTVSLTIHILNTHCSNNSCCFCPNKSFKSIDRISQHIREVHVYKANFETQESS